MLDRTTWLRVAPFALALLTVSPLQACFGKFGLTRALYTWNKNASDDFLVQEVLFLLLAIVQVYTIVAVVDAFILNPIELFTGEHPVGGNASIERVDDGYIVRQLEDGVERTYRIYEGDNGLQLVDETGKAIAATQRLSDGTFEVVDGEGRLLNRPGHSLLASMRDAMLSGDRDTAVALMGTADSCVLVR